MHETFTIITLDHFNLFAQSYTVGDPKAIICLIHGMGEHSGRYTHVAKYFNDHQISFYTMDLRGHGRSQGKRGHMSSYESMMQDIALLIETAALQNTGVPIFLYGHSMGGNLVLNYGIRSGEGICGIIATSPYLRRGFELPIWKIKLATILKRVFPSLSQSTGLDVNFLSKDKRNIEAYAKDPLVHDKITPAFFVEIEKAGRYALQNAANLKVPTLLVHGSADKITDPLASAAFARNNVEKCTFKLLQGGYHELHNDDEKDVLFTEVLSFIHNIIA